MTDSMINPSIVSLLHKVDNRYSLIVLTARRSRELIDGAKPLIEMDSTKPVTIAINEIEEGKITYENVKAGIK
jgi:DNA-directed RNA polymerase subunit omega